MKSLGRAVLCVLAIAFVFSAPSAVADGPGPFIEFQEVDVWHQGGWCILRTTWTSPTPESGDVTVSSEIIC